MATRSKTRTRAKKPAGRTIVIPLAPAITSSVLDVGGRELDLAVACNVLGWIGPVQWVQDEDGDDVYAYPPSRSIGKYLADLPALGEQNEVVPRFSSRLDHAIELAEVARRAGFTLAMEFAPTYTKVNVLVPDLGEPLVSIAAGGSPALTITRAIARAWLLRPDAFKEALK